MFSVHRKGIMMQSIRMLLAVICLCGLSACHSLWGSFYFCKNEQSCEGDARTADVDMGDDAATIGPGQWVNAKYLPGVSVSWVGMSPVPNSERLWVIGSQGEIGYLPDTSNGGESFLVQLASEKVMNNGDPIFDISACKSSNELAAFVIGKKSHYRLSAYGDKTTAVKYVNTDDSIYNSVGCARWSDIAGPSGFAYLSTEQGKDYVIDGLGQLRRSDNSAKPFKVVSSFNVQGDTGFWALRDNEIAKFDENLLLKSSLTVSIGLAALASYSDKDAFYVNRNGSVVRFTEGNSAVGHPLPSGVVVRDIYAESESKVWVVGTNGYVAQFDTQKGSTDFSVEYPLINGETAKRIVVNSSATRVYVITESGKLMLRVLQF